MKKEMIDQMTFLIAQTKGLEKGDPEELYNIVISAHNRPTPDQSSS
jgi:hypothetical protein